MDEKKELSKDEKLLRMVALATILRDDLEDLNLEFDLKQKTNLWLKSANNYLERVGSGGDEVNLQWMKITDKILKAIRDE